MLKYEMPSWFYGEKRVDYGIHEVSVCPRILPRGMLLRPFHYDDSSMYSAVGDIGYIAESVVPGKSKRLTGKSMGLKISNLTIVQYVDDVQLATQWRVRLLYIKHFHGFVDMLYCHFTDMKQVLCILCNAIMLWIFVCSRLYRKRRRGSAVVEEPSWTAGAEKHAKCGLLC